MPRTNGLPLNRLDVDVPIDLHTILGEVALELCQRIPSAYARLMARTSPPWVFITNTTGGSTRVGEIECRDDMVHVRITGITPQAICKTWSLANVDIGRVMDFVAKYLQ